MLRIRSSDLIFSAPHCYLFTLMVRRSPGFSEDSARFLHAFGVQQLENCSKSLLK
jgi:hypothetical protein